MIYGKVEGIVNFAIRYLSTLPTADADYCSNYCVHNSMQVHDSDVNSFELN